MKGDCRDSECAYYPHKHVTFGNLQDFLKNTSRFFELWGNVGTSKTFIAACIANALIEKGVSVSVMLHKEVYPNKDK